MFRVILFLIVTVGMATACNTLDWYSEESPSEDEEVVV